MALGLMPRGGKADGRFTYKSLSRASGTRVFPKCKRDAFLLTHRHDFGRVFPFIPAW